MPKTNDGSLSLPFSLWTKNGSKSEFSTQAKVIFNSKSDHIIQKGQFEFQHGTILKKSELYTEDTFQMEALFQNGSIPFFSLFAVLLLIIFRNRFFSSFQKYFLGLNHNYEIDFNFQKIGALPVFIAVLVVILSSIDLTNSCMNHAISNLNFSFQAFKVVLVLFAFPTGASLILFFLLNLSFKLFPIFFSDLKVLFLLSTIGLAYNFSAFGSQFESLVSIQVFLAFAIGIFFGLRSFFLYKIFQRAYRFKIPITVFYICTLNLQTILIINWVLARDFFRLL